MIRHNNLICYTMKKGNHYLCISLLVLGLISITNTLYSQDQKSVKRELSEEREKEITSNFERLGTLIESKKFMYILDDTKLSLIDYGWVKRWMPKPPYVMQIDSSYAILYLNTPTDDFHISEGSIEGWNLKKDLKKLSFYLTFKIIGPSPLWDLDFYLIIESDNSAYTRVKSGGSDDSYIVFPKYGKIVKIDSSFISK